MIRKLSLNLALFALTSAFTLSRYSDSQAEDLTFTPNPGFYYVICSEYGKKEELKRIEEKLIQAIKDAEKIEEELAADIELAKDKIRQFIGNLSGSDNGYMLAFVAYLKDEDPRISQRLYDYQYLDSQKFKDMVALYDKRGEGTAIKAFARDLGKLQLALAELEGKITSARQLVKYYASEYDYVKNYQVNPDAIGCRSSKALIYIPDFEPVQTEPPKTSDTKKNERK